MENMMEINVEAMEAMVAPSFRCGYGRMHIEDNCSCGGFTWE